MQNTSDGMLDPCCHVWIVKSIHKLAIVVESFSRVTRTSLEVFDVTVARHLLERYYCHRISAISEFPAQRSCCFAECQRMWDMFVGRSKERVIFYFICRHGLDRSRYCHSSWSRLNLTFWDNLIIHTAKSVSGSGGGGAAVQYGVFVVYISKWIWKNAVSVLCFWSDHVYHYEHLFVYILFTYISYIE
jgi:hypothetical protein